MPTRPAGVGPGQAEDVREEALGQAVAAHDALGQLGAGGGQADLAPLRGHQPFHLEALDHLRDGRAGDAQAVSDARLDDVDVVLVQLEDALAVLLEGRMVLPGGGHAPIVLPGVSHRSWHAGSMLAIERTFRERTPRSADHAASADRVMPGGDTRAVGHHPPYQLTLVRGEGPWLTDVDGHRYLDLIGNFTSLVHGNAYPPIIAAARRAMEDGTNWPARNVHAVALAEEIVARVPSVEQLRFTNSGSEATMLAVEIARVATGRRLVLMARYGYHGSAPHFEVGTHGHEGPETLVATYGEAAEFAAILAERGEHIAAVILEPVMGSGGLLAASADFLVAVQQAARAAGALVILDEVITLRLSTGGAQQVLGVRPDLTAMGKIIGGGFPVGAVGGREELLARRPVPAACSASGTFNGNPVRPRRARHAPALDQEQADERTGASGTCWPGRRRYRPPAERPAPGVLQPQPSPPAATPRPTASHHHSTWPLNHGVSSPRVAAGASTVLDGLRRRGGPACRRCGRRRCGDPGTPALGARRAGSSVTPSEAGTDLPGTRVVGDDLGRPKPATPGSVAPWPTMPCSAVLARGVVRHVLPRADPGPGAGLATHHRGPAHADLRADRERQDAHGLPLVHRSAGHVAAAREGPADEGALPVAAAGACVRRREEPPCPAGRHRAGR